MGEREAVGLCLRVGRPVVHAAGQGLDFRLQRSAKRDIQFLHAAADAEKRDARVDGLADEWQRCCVAIPVIRFIFRRWCDTVERRVNVRARSCADNPVDAGNEAVEIERIAEGGNDHRIEPGDPCQWSDI